MIIIKKTTVIYYEPIFNRNTYILHNTPASHGPRPPIRLLLSGCVRVCRGQNPLPQVTGSEKAMNSPLKWKRQRLFSIDLY